MLDLDKVELFVCDDSGVTHDLSSFIVSYRIKWGVFDSIGSFDAEISPGSPWVPAPLGKDTFLWKVCGKNMLCGYVDSWSVAWTKDSRSLRISGRDILSVLSDNGFLYSTSYPREADIKTDAEGKTTYAKWRMESIIEDVFSNQMHRGGTAIDMFSKNLRSFTKPGYTFTDSARQTMAKLGGFCQLIVSPGQTFYEFLAKLVNSAGMYMFVEPGTRTVVFHSFYPSKTKGKSNGTNFGYDGNPLQADIPYTIQHTKNGVGNVKNLDVACDRSKFFTYIKVVGSSNSEGSLYFQGLKPGSYLKKELTFNASSVPRNKTVVRTEDDEMIWNRIPEIMTYNQAILQAYYTFQWRYTLPNHSPPHMDEPYFINRTADLWDEYVLGNADEEPCFIMSVEFSGSKTEGQSTSMQLLPKRYIGMDVK